MSLNSQQNGFTLIEAMVVIVLIGVVAAIALPSFKSVIDGRRLAGAAEHLFANLNYARSEAIKQNQNVQFQFDTNKWCYGIDDTGADCDCSGAPNDCQVSGQTKVYDDSDYPGVVLSVSGIAGDAITFEPRQGLTDNAATFIFSLGQRQRSVSVNAVGRIKMD